VIEVPVKINPKLATPAELITSFPPLIVLLVIPGSPKAVLPEAAVMFVARVIGRFVFLYRATKSFHVIEWERVGRERKMRGRRNFRIVGNRRDLRIPLL
jgi:hypothetical protein